MCELIDFLVPTPDSNHKDGITHSWRSTIVRLLSEIESETWLYHKIHFVNNLNMSSLVFVAEYTQEGGPSHARAGTCCIVPQRKAPAYVGKIYKKWNSNCGWS